MSDEDAELVREFVVECIDQLDAVDNDLLALEKDPTNNSLLGKIFRAYHNMKGSSGFLKFHKLESLTHIGESLLSKMREGKIILNSEITLALIAMGNAVRDIFKAIEATGKDGESENLELKSRLTAVMSTNPSSEANVNPVAPIKDALDLEIEEAIKMAKERRVGEIKSGIEDPKNSSNKTKSNFQELKKNIPVTAEVPKIGDETKSATDSSVRINIDVLDKLMNLAGELVLTRNQILQSYVPSGDEFMTQSLQVLSRITTEIQFEVMKTRMQPINNIFNKFPRIVRSLADTVSKKINLEIEGKDTELDRTLIDSLRDPLTHMVRNSVDHGIELPEKRKASGKSEVGTIKLKAYHEGGMVHIDIIDDGGGIDPALIKATAIEKELIKTEQAALMTEKEILHLIFLPGFSTAAAITNISGRGVGMDVVKTNIEKIGGTVDISSVVGEGAFFSLKIPLTLAIIPALIIGTGNSRIAIPQVNIKELLLIEVGDSKSIDIIHGSSIFNFRNETIPLLNLDKELGIVAKENKKEEGLNIIVVQVEGQLLALLVSMVFDSQEIVVKPLAPQLEGLTVFAGATILGDGKIALILDVLGLAYQAKAISKIKAKIKKAIEGDSNVNKKLSQILVCKTIENGRMAIELEKIVRIETIDKKAFEIVGGKEVVQYRGSVLLVFRALNMLPERRAIKRIPDGLPENEFLDFLDLDQVHVVIYSIRGHEIGLVAGQVLDSIESDLSNLGPSTRPGVKGTIIENNKVIEILNIEKMIATVNPEFMMQTAI